MNTSPTKSNLVILALTLSAGLCHQAVAQSIVYRETFGNDTGGNAALSTVSWLADGYNGTTLQTGLTFDGEGGSTLGISGGTGRTTVLDNINAGGTSSSLTNGLAYIGNGNPTLQRSLLYTTEYTALDFSDITRTSFYSGNSALTAQVRPAFQVGGTWYVPNADFATSSTADFAADAALETFDFVGTTQFAALNGTDLTISGTVSNKSAITGTVAAFGVFAETPTSGYADYVRIDTYEVTAIPEPATAALLFGITLFGLTIIRRRK